MSNNSMVCADGGEIGRAQAAQAEACVLAPHTDMNPILLKPTGSLGSQVVLNGLPWRNLRASEYYEHFEFLRDRVMESYTRLAAAHDFIVIEGAGSITELNLKHCDLVNLGLAQRLKARSILVADIDRGGIFASVIGTFQLLEPGESALVRSFIVNRFRGDRALFCDGVKILEQKTSLPCLGVFPFIQGIHLDSEDSVALDDRQETGCVVRDRLAGSSRSAIVRFPHISNFTDFRLLPEATYVAHPVAEQFDTIFLPGTKSTIEDMLWLRSSGMEQWVFRQLDGGARIIGVCGGYQMLCEEIVDPWHVESNEHAVRGLGLLPGQTQMLRDKITRRVRARTPSGIRFEAYEIHMGITTTPPNSRPFAFLEDGLSDGVRLSQVTGTYLHGAIENKAVLEELLGHAIGGAVSDKDAHYDRLADWFAEHVNHEAFCSEYLGAGI